MYTFKAGVLIFAASTIASPAHAACPMALAVYAEQERIAEIDFTPTLESSTVTNSFRMLLPNDLILVGMVQWSSEPVPYARPYGTITYKCPEGDATGEEFAACTIWQGVLYGRRTIALSSCRGLRAKRRLNSCSPVLPQPCSLTRR